jgi:hypothetical protein
MCRLGFASTVDSSQVHVRDRPLDHRPRNGRMAAIGNQLDDHHRLRAKHQHTNRNSTHATHLMRKVSVVV